GGVGILLKGFFTQFSKINSNFIGTTKDGEEGIGNEGDGISIVDSSSNNTIGGLLKELSNVIGGNKNHGIAILGGGSNNILANLIGMVKKTDGTKKPLGNLAHGILLQNSFKNLLNKCQIGGNKKNGVGISGISSKLNKIFGVIIGSDSSGTTGLGNGLNGISIFNMASNNSVGGFGKDSSVTIVASKKYGVFTSDLLSGFKNAIKNASIGLLKSTNTQLNKNNNTTINIKMPNLLGGMCLENTQHMQIGLPSAPNMIAGNSGPGIIFKGFATKLNKVFANFFGTDSIGTEGLGNLGANIKMFNGANNNWIGNEKEENGNILVASKSHGIELTNTSKNKILNNMVGLFKRPLLPTKKMGNLIGLFINNSNSTIVKKSIFSGNRKDGMRITGSGSMFSRIIENAFGTDLKGEGIHGNGGNGICVDGGANNITIGSNKPEEKNYINSNALFGLLLKNANNISLINSNIGADKKSFLSDFYKNRKGGVHVEKSDNSSLGSAINSIVNNVGNIVSGYDSSGIKITKSFRTLVKNNKIFSSFIGVKATQSSSANIVRNIIRNCIKAISIEDDPNNLISGNIISRSTGLASSIHMYNSGGKIEGNIITDDAGDAIYLEDGSNPIVTKNNIYNNSGFGLRNESSGITINAQSNWWGDSGGPSGQGSGGGDKVSSNVNFQNWETEVSNLIVLGGQDTTYQTPGATDTLFSSVLNWSNPSDIVDISIDDLKGWITGQKSFSISLDDSLGSSFPISISIPNGTTQGELTKITINAKSQSNNSHTDETDFYVATHSPVLSKIVLSPDSANVTVGDTLQFSVIGYDQIFHQLNFMAQWNASLGTIDTSGMFIAGESSGIAKVSVSDPITKLVSEAIVVIGTPTDIKEEASELPNEFVLAQNYPNPFNPTTKIRFSLPETSDVKLKVYNIIGEQVTTLVNNSMDAGVHEVNFDASSLSSGVYIYRIVAGNFSDVKKMILLQ
ncbi:MAG: NosD domain-containing protein, partial [Melioribacteraceae bacterium]